jgi:hypothetical protein
MRFHKTRRHILLSISDSFNEVPLWRHTDPWKLFYMDSIQTTCTSLKFAYGYTSPILVEIGEIGGSLAISY